MNVKCPYCQCNYELTKEMLGNPTGDPRLGYGWWLKCYKCHKKFWLKNIEFSRKLESSISVDKKAKIDRISAFTNKIPRKILPKKSKFFKSLKWIIIVMLILSAGFWSYHNKDLFTKYFTEKAQKLFKNVTNELILSNVKYGIGNGKLSVLGTISNENKSLINIKGVRVRLFSKEVEIQSWDNKLSSDYVLPGDKVQFSFENKIDNEISVQSDVKVEVSIF